MSQPSARLLVLFLILASITVSQTLAQDKDKKDPQNAFEPRSKPGDGQKFLEKFVGDWQVLKSFHPRTGDPVQQKGECKQTMIQGGRFLQSEFVFFQGEEKTTGLGLIGYDADTEKFTSVWIDSRSTRMSHRQADSKFDGKEIVLASKTLQEGEKTARRSRTVTKLEEDGKKIVHRQYNLTDDGKERLLMELVLTRKTLETQKK